VEREVPLRGRGRVRVAGYGIQDAEHLVEKEIGRAWPEARVEIVEIRRGEGGRIVEEFEVSYRILATVAVPSADRDRAPSLAYRHARARLAGTRYERTAWEEIEF
jgi:hypothetical protein